MFLVIKKVSFIKLLSSGFLFGFLFPSPFTDVKVFVYIGLVCTKTTGFLFVKLRRESRRRYEDFCEEEQEKYVALGQSDTEAPGEVFESHMGLFQEKICCRTLSTVSELALLFWPQPFFAGPHGDLCPRGKA